MEHLSSPSDLTDKEWHLIEPLLPRVSQSGRPRKYAWRAILKAIFYGLWTGCQWRFFPHDFPKWKTAYHDFGRWRQEHIWERRHTR